jgi:hypothetical protein
MAEHPDVTGNLHMGITKARVCNFPVPHAEHSSRTASTPTPW